jgi:hypothetical protein
MNINKDLTWKGVSNESRFEIESRFNELTFAIARAKSNSSNKNNFDSQCMLILYSLIEKQLVEK